MVINTSKRAPVGEGNEEEESCETDSSLQGMEKRAHESSKERRGERGETSGEKRERRKSGRRSLYRRECLKEREKEKAEEVEQ